MHKGPKRAELLGKGRGGANALEGGWDGVLTKDQDELGVGF